MAGGMRIDMDPASLTLARSQGANGTGAARGPDGTANRRMEEAKDAAKQFETMFVELMMKSMRKTAMPEEASNAQGIYQEMLDTEYSKSMGETGGLGIQDLVLNWIKTVEPNLESVSADGAEATSEKSLGAGKRALNDLALQQYRLQAALPIGGGGLGGERD